MILWLKAAWDCLFNPEKVWAQEIACAQLYSVRKFKQTEIQRILLQGDREC